MSENASFICVSESKSIGTALWNVISPAWFRRSRTGGSSARIVLYTIGVVLCS